MKKLLAMGSAAALGTMGLLVTAAPAQAATDLPPCQSTGEHFALPGTTSESDWYMPCVPQYGSGKQEAQFRFISDNGFPTGFDPNSATVTTDFDDEAAGSYTGDTVTEGFTSSFTLVSSTPNERTYDAGMILQIAGVSKADPSALPSSCEGTYGSVFRVDFVPRTITFSQGIDGKTYTFQGTVGADPMLIGATFTGDPESNVPINPDAPACVAVGSDVDYVEQSGGLLPRSGTTFSPFDVKNTADVGPVSPLYTLSFNSQGGSAAEPEEVREGDQAKPPATTRQGYTLTGWFTEPTGGEKWNFDAPVRSDMTLYAQWKINTYTVTFDTQHGSSVAAATVDYGSSVTKPADPTRDGFTFAGWYTEPSGGSLWNFDSAIRANVTLYAQWKAVPVPAAAVPELAATGSDLSTWSMAGIGMLLVGAATTVLPFARRRRKES